MIEPSEPFDGDESHNLLDVPELDTALGGLASACALHALYAVHAQGMAIGGTKHNRCMTGTHTAYPCSCCASCGPRSVAMLAARRRRKEFKNLSWQEYYANLVYMAGLPFEEFSSEFESAPQPDHQWVDDGDDVLAVEYELPTRPRARLETKSGKLRKILEDEWPDELVTLALTVLGEIAAQGRRRELDGDSEKQVSPDKVAHSLNAPQRNGRPRVAEPLTGAVVRQILIDVAGALATAPRKFDTWVKFVRARLDVWVFRYVVIDDSLDRINAASVHGELDHTPVHGGQDGDARESIEREQLRDAVLGLLLPALRPLVTKQNFLCLDGTKRENRLERRVRTAVKDHLRDEAESRGLADDTFETLLGADFTTVVDLLVLDIAADLRLTLAQEEADRRVDAARRQNPGLTPDQEIAVRVAVLAEWEITMRKRKK